MGLPRLPLFAAPVVNSATRGTKLSSQGFLCSSWDLWCQSELQEVFKEGFSVSSSF